MKLKMFKILSLVAMSGMLLTSCIKNDDGKFNSSGSTFVKLPDAPEEIVALALELKPGFQDVLLLDVRRDAPTAAELQKAVTVKIKNNTALVAAFNAANGTGYISLPTNAYTVDAGNPFNGQEWTVTFNPGEFAKPIMIKLDPTKLDLSEQYGMGFTITDAGGAKISDGLQNLIVEIGVKNRFDGIYTMTGTLQDLAVPTIVAKSPQEVQLITTGANSVYLRNSGTTVGSFLDLFPIMNNGSESAYGAFTPEFIFDNNNNVTAVVNAYGQPASNTRSAAIDPSGVNKWDPVTKTLKVKWYMYQPSAIAGIRAYFDFTFTYKGSR